MNNPKRVSQPVIGLVVPCYNEEEMLPVLVDRLASLSKQSPYALFILFVDDGSRDKTFAMMTEACLKFANMSCIKLSRNFGHQTAVTAGLAHIRGDVIAVIDADLQDPPEIIFEMIEKWKEGYDVVYGIRTGRKENALLRLSYALFYRLLSKIAHIEIPLDAGDFSIMDRRVVDWINAMPEHNRFVRGLRGWLGFRQYGMPYERSARLAGKPKYNVRRLINLAMDGMISFSSVPLRLASWLGVCSSILGFIVLIWALLNGFVYGRTPPGWASLAVIMLFFGGIQLVVLGIMGEYIGRIFDEVKNRPHYIVADHAGWLSNGDGVDKTL